MSFEPLLYDFDKAIEWIESLHVKADVLRFAKYRKLLRSISGAVQRGDMDAALSIWDEGNNALFEAYSLIEIYHALSSTECASFVQGERREFVKGPEHVRDENPAKSTNSARNYAFELQVAARFGIGEVVRLELDPAFATVVDVPFRTPLGHLFMECKRPQGENSVEECYDLAQSGLRDRYAMFPDTVARGIIALDITKIVNPKGQLLWIDSVDEASALQIKGLRAEFEWDRRVWEKPAKSEQTIGLYFHMAHLAFVRNPQPALRYVRSGSLQRLSGATPADAPWFQQLEDAARLANRAMMYGNLIRGYR